MNTTREPAKITGVPHQPQEGRTHRSVTVFDAPWEVMQAATETCGENRNKVIEALIDWYLNVPGAELPERPPAELTVRLFADFDRRKAAIGELALTLKCEQCGVPNGPCLVGKAKKPTGLTHRSRTVAATALYKAQQSTQQ